MPGDAGNSPQPQGFCLTGAIPINHTALHATGGGNVPAIAGVIAAGGTTAQGSTDGGDAVVIMGSDFTADSQVSFVSGHSNAATLGGMKSSHF